MKGWTARALLVAAAMVCGFEAAHAETDAYPQRAVTLVVPFPAGSATDAVARKVGEGLQKALGQPFIIDNRAGAGGLIAVRHVITAKPDGYTLMIATNTTHAANPSIYKSLPYDPKKDFTPIGGIIRIPYLVAVRADSPANTLAEFVQVARAAKSPLSYGTGNTGGRASGELLKARLGFDMMEVPYRGSPQAITDLIGGHIDVCFPDPASALSLLHEKKFKVLAVTGPKRVPSLPDVPTVMESGAPDYSIVAWVGAFAPAGTPQPIVEKLNAAINAQLRDPAMVEFINQIGAEVFATTPARLSSYVEEDTRRWAELVELAKIPRK
ncbi:ABC transporter substrate-binding protein [Azorhizobium oxalatiphilum]|uniref:ABC transporter substrate-binding protein n=1 Tax=Azorhizobium oxalatiphilum TaxID=980631 RepID=A0A917F8L2_9HYPH|nr:tripartite tricarboxylate transporter substrate binding protein [Azorhizobium oxalatiphilum]GGF53534.1 ABC transporter substrate-binding protein [Azorhizobium oxalatiphilum]